MDDVLYCRMAGPGRKRGRRSTVADTALQEAPSEVRLTGFIAHLEQNDLMFNSKMPA